MGTARLRIPASGENGEPKSDIVQTFDLEGKTDLEQGGLSQ